MCGAASRHTLSYLLSYRDKPIYINWNVQVLDEY
nr:MAG TPA: YnbE-like lipoprotein [Caudoviricetes sp.]DAU62994.1 MAG TPA: YnbE-like lipoprotein [Caudoviricetes sp.]